MSGISGNLLQLLCELGDLSAICRQSVTCCSLYDTKIDAFELSRLEVDSTHVVFLDHRSNILRNRGFLKADHHHLTHVSLLPSVDWINSVRRGAYTACIPRRARRDRR